MFFVYFAGICAREATAMELGTQRARSRKYTKKTKENQPFGQVIVRVIVAIYMYA